MSDGTLIKHNALQQPLPWKDQVEALPDNAKLNTGSTNPILAAEMNHNRQIKAGYREVIYWPPAADAGYRVYLTQREADILLALASWQWVPIRSLKGTSDTRKPVSNMRAFGLIIATAHFSGDGDCYRLLGRVDLSPLPWVSADAVQVTDLLPDRETALAVEVERARSAFTKRVALAKKRASHLSPQQMHLPDTAA
jgi:hypothetical protein